MKSCKLNFRSAGAGLVLALAVLAATWMPGAAIAKSPYQGDFTNATTYRMAILDVRLNMDGSMLVGHLTRTSGPEGVSLSWETVCTVPAERVGHWIDMLRSFRWNQLILVVPHDKAEVPYLVAFSK